VVSLALVALTLVGNAAAPAATTCATPPAVVPVGSIVPGVTGTGLTAISGSSPTSFDIQVIGTLPDAILPGGVSPVELLRFRDELTPKLRAMAFRRARR
jgi:hypothetical protein